ncbi:MAG: glutaredoxin family protein [Candidatus Limnocylindria bacterium]|nr:glutaredoxin family protein [Chloroflexota bacterium]MDQ3401684.1 glutaredoxin family protein [Chloroflexota bacterium]
MLRGNLRRALALVRNRTHREEPLRVTLYERAGCALCEETHRALRRIALDRALEIQRVDIDGDGSIRDVYTLRVPVLRLGDDELDTAGLEDRAIARWLAAVG